MNLITFSLFDTKTASYGQPFFFNHIAQASRALTELVNDPGTTVGRYPTDYQLHELAVFDDQTGMFTSGFRNHGPLSAWTRATAPMVLDQVEG